MTSVTTTPGRGANVRRVPGRGYGAVLFASMLMMVIGCSAVIHGIAAVANSHVFAHYAAANLRTWSTVVVSVKPVAEMESAFLVTSAADPVASGV